jgi:hypothetical protein
MTPRDGRAHEQTKAKLATSADGGLDQILGRAKMHRPNSSHDAA